MNDGDDPHHTSWFIRASRFGPPRSCEICLNPVWRRGRGSARESVASSNGRQLTASEAGEPTEPSWIQTNLATNRWDQTGGLIESCIRFPGYGTVGVLSFPDSIVLCLWYKRFWNILCPMLFKNYLRIAWSDFTNIVVQYCALFKVTGFE